AYMSPEQASGERELDGRSDVHSLGVVLYEMLAGEPPFSGPSAQAIVARRLTEAPRPLRTLRDSVPEAVEQVASRALARTPADRYSSAGELAQALEDAARLAPSEGATATRATQSPPATPTVALPTSHKRR